MLIYFCLNVRIVSKAGELICQNKVQDDSVDGEEETDSENESEDDKSDEEKQSQNKNLDEDNYVNLNEVEDENLEGIEYDGYLCYK